MQEEKKSQARKNRNKTQQKKRLQILELSELDCKITTPDISGALDRDNWKVDLDRGDRKS